MRAVRRAASRLAVWCLALCPAFGSEFQELNTDRDAFTPATTTAKFGSTIIEASYVWIDNRDTPPTNSFPELLVRLGTRERFEWRLGVNYEQGSGGSVVSAVEVGEAPLGEAGGEEATILYGAKIRVTDQDGWIPHTRKSPTEQPRVRPEFGPAGTLTGHRSRPASPCNGTGPRAHPQAPRRRSPAVVPPTGGRGFISAATATRPGRGGRTPRWHTRRAPEPASPLG